MAKPTLLQSLLNRPSQTYSFPQEKMYYSTKRDMVRIATETHGGEVPHTEDSMDSKESAVVRVVRYSVFTLGIYEIGAEIPYARIHATMTFAKE